MTLWILYTESMATGISMSEYLIQCHVHVCMMVRRVSKDVGEREGKGVCKAIYREYCTYTL